MLNTILSELQTAAGALPSRAVEVCARRIASHPRVFVYGAGRSGLMLRALAMRLVQMDRCAYVVGETITPAIQPGDILILASASGKTHTVCHYAETAKKLGADLLIISAAERSPLTDISPADVCFTAPSKDSSGASSQVMGSLFEQLLLLFCDAMIQYLAADPQTMRQNHANLE